MAKCNIILNMSYKCFLQENNLPMQKPNNKPPKTQNMLQKEFSENKNFGYD